ncbi:NAD(P)H-dependent oxidoreductase [Candidatus Methylacidiphilum infernorum]|uniref:NAD(P)H-dependent oxidoreductase n=1 Tax=Candidatus Methylacidiphilum infernorum TaxID=511746 RepID=A0ABX7PW72_9BACT|nr:NADPH-dependent FMN reductase [Candidatus Methylacidiphilum infernorum]QSR87270.1 NAD(P)H-dependent oxidoreductase [Candidatus Methylacidiphilum infernorum]
MIGVLIGTNRVGSKSRLVAAQLVRLYSKLDQKINVIDLGALPKEAWAGTVFKKLPLSILPMVRRTVDCKGLVIVYPEYNGSIPGSLKHYIDILPHPESLARKPVCLVGVARGSTGALRASTHLEAILFYRRAFIYPFPLYLAKIDELLEGKCAIEQENIQKKMLEQAMGFLEFLKRSSP